MYNLQRSLQRELECFKAAIELDGGSIPHVSKAAFCKARQKLKPSAFTALSDIVLEEFYKSEAIQTWHGYRVIGIDGSTIELPNSKDIIEKYGVYKTRDDGKTTSMARTLLVYDVLNHLTIKASMDKMSEAETTILWNLLPDMQLNTNDLLVFDRYYPSHLLFFYLQQRGVQFCFRMKKNWWKEIEHFYNSGEESCIVTLLLPKKEKEEAKNLSITATKLQCRLTRIELEGGETEILLTSLTDANSFSVDDTKHLYGLRWGIEETYKTLKHKMCIENFSGKSQRAVLQDFYVKILIMNLTAVAVRPINEALKKQTVKVKYPHQVNVIEALAAMKNAITSFFITNKMSKALKKLFERITKSTEPIRKGRKFKRKHQPKRKYYMCYKPV